MAKKNITCEKELSKWFIKNHKSLGYEEIVRNNNGRFPDFTMKKDGKEIGVELETLSSNFILHKHNPKKCDEIVCVRNDKEIGINTIEISELNFTPKIVRVSATIEEDTHEKLMEIMKRGNYRNMSHAVESIILSFKEENK